MRILAVDPGLEGAAVVWSGLNGTVMMLVSFIDLPIVGEVPSGGSRQRPFASWVVDRAWCQPRIVEAAGARPRPRSSVRCSAMAASSGRLKESWRPARCRCHSSLVHVEEVPPPRLLKEDCRARAIQLLPSASGKLQRVKDHHRARRSCSASTGSSGGSQHDPPRLPRARHRQNPGLVRPGQAADLLCGDRPAPAKTFCSCTPHARR